MQYLYYTLLGLVAYMMGNMSGARIVAKAKNSDITTAGSGNPGTLNVWRTYGFWPGIFTFVFDAVKGTIPTLVAYLTFGYLGCDPEIAVYVAGFSVILGHIFPVVYKFKGGKGIATSVGIFVVINWWVSLIAFAVMIVGMLFIKYASIFTIGYVVAMSIVEICVMNPAVWVNYIFVSAILFLVVWAHRGNVVRLLKGKENKTELLAMLKKMGKKKSAATQSSDQSK